MSKPIVSIKEGFLSFGKQEVFSGIDLNIYHGDKICLVGKNGQGKSTLLQIIADKMQLDGGCVWKLNGIKIAFLQQQFDKPNNITVLEFLKHNDDKYAEQDLEFKIDILSKQLGINKKAIMSDLSGGQTRRVYLAKVLLLEADLLLLDEPTNHLDIQAIDWLEGFILGYKGAVVCISHDRQFLYNISNKTWWIDKGSVLINNRGYKYFDDWAVSVYEQRQRELEKLSKKLEDEEVWRQQGVTGRRKRNERRLAELKSLRQKMKDAQHAMKLDNSEIHHILNNDVKKSKLVMMIDNISYNINSVDIVKDFSLILSQGEKLGLIGPNGSGKTTLLKLIMGEILPSSGRIKIGKNLDITYYDQKRTALDPDETLWSTLAPGGNDHVKVGSNVMHVVGYLKKFMFDPKQAKDKVATLSGGQANRLMLAKILADPKDILILDEPTNDLDMDTLDMIYDILYDYPGTLIMVSHDRDFTQRLVTKTLIFDGTGKIDEFYGEYGEYQDIINQNKEEKKTKKSKNLIKSNNRSNNKLSFKIQYELDNLPRQIDSLETEITDIKSKLYENSLYQENIAEFTKLSKELQEKEEELQYLWEKWSAIYSEIEGN